jgi:hypothetical protein
LYRGPRVSSIIVRLRLYRGPRVSPIIVRLRLYRGPRVSSIIVRLILYRGPRVSPIIVRLILYRGPRVSSIIVHLRLYRGPRVSSIIVHLRFCLSKVFAYYKCIFLVRPKTALIVTDLPLISGFRREVDEICCLLDITRRRVVIVYRRFGTTYRSHLDP